jgi:hypothetical protein
MSEIILSALGSFLFSARGLDMGGPLSSQATECAQAGRFGAGFLAPPGSIDPGAGGNTLRFAILTEAAT